MGWKVGGIPPQFQEKFGAKRVAGPVFANGVLRCNAGDTLDMGAYPGGFAAMEAEYIVVLKDEFTLPDRDVTLADMADLVADVHIGI